MGETLYDLELVIVFKEGVVRSLKVYDRCLSECLPILEEEIKSYTVEIETITYELSKNKELKF